MGWISLHRAAELAGIDRKNGRYKLLNLKKKHPKIHKKLVRKRGVFYELKEPEIVIFFQTDFRRFEIKPFLENLVSKAKDLIRIDKSIISKAKDLQSQSQNKELEYDINEIIEQTTDPMALDRLAVTINICHDYSMGLNSLEECANNHHVDRNKFYRWCNNSPQMQSFYDQAIQIRNQYLRERDIEQSADNIRKIARGCKIKTEVIDYEIHTDSKGKKTWRPIKGRITKKWLPPDKEANIFLLTNRDPRNWKRHAPFEDLLKDKPRPEDRFEKMSKEELDKYLADGYKRWRN